MPDSAAASACSKLILLRLWPRPLIAMTPAVAVMPATKMTMPITRIMPIPLSERVRSVRRFQIRPTIAAHPLFLQPYRHGGLLDVDAAPDDRVVVHLEPNERGVLRLDRGARGVGVVEERPHDQGRSLQALLHPRRVAVARDRRRARPGSATRRSGSPSAFGGQLPGDDLGRVLQVVRVVVDPQLDVVRAARRQPVRRPRPGRPAPGQGHRRPRPGPRGCRATAGRGSPWRPAAHGSRHRRGSAPAPRHVRRRPPARTPPRAGSWRPAARSGSSPGCRVRARCVIVTSPEPSGTRGSPRRRRRRCARRLAPEFHRRTPRYSSPPIAFFMSIGSAMATFCHSVPPHHGESAVETGLLGELPLLVRP